MHRTSTLIESLSLAISGYGLQPSPNSSYNMAEVSQLRSLTTGRLFGGDMFPSILGTLFNRIHGTGIFTYVGLIFYIMVHVDINIPVPWILWVFKLETFCKNMYRDIYTLEMSHSYQNGRISKEIQIYTFSKPSFLVSMLNFGCVPFLPQSWK